MAGFREVLAVEWDTNAVESFKRNFKSVPVWSGDVGRLDGEVALAMAKIEKGQLDVLDGSPPCQGFSTAGKREMHDARNSLFKEYARLLGIFHPKAFIMENVSGMVKGKMRIIFAECMRELKGVGYAVRARVLNAKFYGVPQSRQRLIVIGIRNDIGIEPSHPGAATLPISVEEAIGSIDTEPVVNKLELKDKYGRLYGVIPQGKNAACVLNGAGHGGCRKLSARRPAETIRKMQGKCGFATLVHPTEDRAVSIAEVKALSTFPQDFWLSGKYETQWAQIGNAVPPRFMYHIAKHVSGLLRQE